MATFSVTLTNNETQAIASRHGWTSTVFDPPTGSTVPNPVSARQFFRAWLPKMLANEIFAGELQEAEKAARTGVVKKTLADATES